MKKTMKKNMQPGLIVIAAILVLVGLAVFLASASNSDYIKTSFMPATIAPCPYPRDEFPENWPYPPWLHDACYSNHEYEGLPSRPSDIPELGLPWLTSDPALIPPTPIYPENRLESDFPPEPSNIPGFDAHDPFDTDLHVEGDSAWVTPVDS